MTALAGTQVAIPVPENWVALPTLVNELGSEWMTDRLPNWVDDADRERLRSSAAKLVIGVESTGHPHRKRFALLTIAEPVGFRAVLQTDISAVDAGDAESALQAAQVAPVDSATFRREVLGEPVGDTPAVAVHELIVNGTDDDPSRLQEVFSIVVFPPLTGIAIHLTFTSPDLAAFPDIVAFGRGIAEGITVTLPVGEDVHE